MRRALAAAAVTALIATVPTQCGNPPSIRGNPGTPCEKPPQATFLASATRGTVDDMWHRNVPGCSQIWMLQVNGRWFAIGQELWSECRIGSEWGPPSGSAWDPYRCH